MGRVGPAGDNSAMESFFALLQKNVLNRRSWATREELRVAIVTWIEHTHHRRRRQPRLGLTVRIRGDHEHAACSRPDSSPANGTGLRGRVDRVAAVGGTVDLKSPRGGGTRLDIRIPLKDSQ